MKQPITFIHRNLVFGRDRNDAWATFRLDTRAYAGLTRTSKLELLGSLASFAYSVESDFSLLRVASPWSVDDYVSGVEATTDSRHLHREVLDDYLKAQRDELAERGSHVPSVFLSIRLTTERASTLGSLESHPAVQALRRFTGAADARGISRRQLDDLLAEETKAYACVLDYLDCEQASSDELQWLIRRGFCRSLGDPMIDERFRPQALVLDAPEEEGGLRYQPLEMDVLRFMDSPIEVGGRGLTIRSELGTSHQAFLCVGALPESVPFPGRRAELLFAPLEALDFPVDAAFSARHVSNGDALRLVRRRVIDADNIFREESHGDHGPSSSAAERPQAARQLEDYLSAGDHPPLLQAGISLCVSGSTAEELEDRVQRLRREYGSVKLHRPLGEQLRLFMTHMPGQPSLVPDYDDYLTVEQFGAMVPVATHAVGSEAGPYVGHTLVGARQPVLFDPTEACRTSRAPATLLSGTLGSGKTLCMELIMYQAFLSGSTICDIDPKGDHALERLPGVAEHMEVIELSADERYRGMLDPLRIAPDDTREDLATNFLFSMLPEPLPSEWRTEIKLAVQTVVAAGGTSCGEVIEVLEQGTDAARDAGRSLTIHATSGLARLGFADRGSQPPDAGAKQITSLRISNLSLPLPGTPRGDLLEDERVAQALLHLLAVYALRLTTRDPHRHAVLGFDEAWVLLADGAGRALVDRIARLGRAQNVTPLLATQILGDVDELEGLIGAAFCFGVESDREARKALRLLHLDEEDAGLRQRLQQFRRGRCFVRDYTGRVGPVQIDLVVNDVLTALDTTPEHREPVAASVPAARRTDVPTPAAG